MQELDIIQQDGFKSYVRYWKAVDANANIFVHTGMADHSKRFDHFSKRLSLAGYNVISYDYRSHGKSLENGKKPGQFRWDNGFKLLLDDAEHILAELPNSSLPLVLFGHSFGSAVARALAFRLSPKAIILSGCPYNDALSEKYGKYLLGILSAFYGKEKNLKLLSKMSYEKFNQSFKPNRTDFDWISSLEIKVDDYNNDPLAGYPCSIGFYKTMMEGFSLLRSKRKDEIDLSCPTLLLGGAQDSVTLQSKSLKDLEQLFTQNPKRKISRIEYANNRHECLNDRSSEELISDVISWLKTLD